MKKQFFIYFLFVNSLITTQKITGKISSCEENKSVLTSKKIIVLDSIQQTAIDTIIVNKNS